jgi:beta-1,2-xylosyltransferase
MAINLPFPSALKLPVPRRLAILLASVLILISFLHTFAPSTLPPALVPSLPHHEPDASYFSPSKWIPPILYPNRPELPAEFDDDGQCIFLSPFDALSTAEKARAEYLELVEVSSGVVRSKFADGGDGRRQMESVDSGVNETGTVGMGKGWKPSGMTHPILGLLREGEVKWNDRMARQSKTLDQAVAVYEERWGRPPPKGFDLWCVLVRLQSRNLSTDMIFQVEFCHCKSRSPPRRI